MPLFNGFEGKNPIDFVKKNHYNTYTFQVRENRNGI